MPRIIVKTNAFDCFDDSAEVVAWAFAYDTRDPRGKLLGLGMGTVTVGAYSGDPAEAIARATRLAIDHLDTPSERGPGYPRGSDFLAHMRELLPGEMSLWYGVANTEHTGGCVPSAASRRRLEIDPERLEGPEFAPESMADVAERVEADEARREAEWAAMTPAQRAEATAEVATEQNSPAGW